ncbi:hypothetical protein HPB52_001471 [Rhipicephalus sanguineus]|uniref:Uncharacterized protein n=1 Tax=Rhipicephalus sanguineus TaxID=34632 RepID=A0A9D4PDU0_RHISA|nr:hypothetical protein HPB52_001471 [Rhipicephalus sanguineus]
MEERRISESGLAGCTVPSLSFLMLSRQDWSLGRAKASSSAGCDDAEVLEVAEKRSAQWCGRTAAPSIQRILTQSRIGILRLACRSSWAWLRKRSHLASFAAAASEYEFAEKFTTNSHRDRNNPPLWTPPLL